MQLQCVLDPAPGRRTALKQGLAVVAMAGMAGPASAQIVSLNEAINKAGRQRMLSQRTAKFYLSRCWGADDPDQIKELNIARKEFAEALNLLTNAPQATRPIKDELALARQQWVFFDNALARLSGHGQGNGRHAAEVFTSSENILQVMDRVTGLYGKLS